MSSKSTSATEHDKDKTWEQLLSELQELRAQVAILKKSRAKSEAVGDALRESEGRLGTFEAVEVEKRRLFNLLENLPVMVCLLTRDYRIVFANRAFREKFGEPRGRHCYDYCFGRSGPCEFCESYKVLETGRPHRWEVTGPDGSTIDVHDVPFADVDGAPMILEMDIDITERKRAEELLQVSEANLAMAQSISHVGNYSVDIARDLAQCSDEFYHILGLEPQDHFSYTQFLSCVHPEDRVVVDHNIREAWDQGSAIAIEYRIFQPDGELRFIRSEGNMILDETGRTVRMFGIIQDITERKKTEEELEKAKALAEVYLDLMGHDINNMNQVAMGYLEIALGSLRLTDEEQELLQKPLDKLKNSSKLIENVRKLQKIESGALRNKKIDLCVILDEVKEDYSHIPDRNVTINIKPLPHCYVVANELIKDVFSNLVDNAIKHSDPRKPLTINMDLELIKEKGRDFYKVIVEDDGPGIPDDVKTRLFMRFQRGKTKASGKGLGLYLVRTLVSEYHGRIWVEDRVPGDYTKGARFVVILPVAE